MEGLGGDRLVYLPYISPISPLHLPYISQVLAEWKASAGIASYYDAGVRLSSKTGESGLGLGLTPVNTYPNLIPNQVRQVRVRVSIALTLFLNQARQARRDRRQRRRRRWGGNCGTRAGRGGGLLPINWPGGPRRRRESRYERHAEAAAGPSLTLTLTLILTMATPKPDPSPNPSPNPNPSCRPDPNPGP